MEPHRAFIEAWLSRRAGSATLAQQALSVVWSRALRGVSELTLLSLARAARDAAARAHPLLSDVRVEPGGFDTSALRDVPGREASAALGALLVELLALVELISGEILAPTLQAELMRLGRRS